MGKMKVSRLADVAGELRWRTLHTDGGFCYCVLTADGMLELYHEGRTERLSGCSVSAATFSLAMLAVYALYGSKGVQEAMARLSVTFGAQN
jgi:hypothetical protein